LGGPTSKERGREGREGRGGEGRGREERGGKGKGHEPPPLFGGSLRLCSSSLKNIQKRKNSS